MLKKVQSLVEVKKYLVRLHARERMLERDILFQEIRECLENSKIIENYFIRHCLVFPLVFQLVQVNKLDILLLLSFVVT